MSRLWQFLCAVSAALPCFIMGARLARVWKDPMSVESGRWVKLGVGILVLEVVLVHSGVACVALFGAREGGIGRMLMSLGGLSLMYLVFAGAIALAFKSRVLLESALLVMAGRGVAVLIGVTQDQARFIAAQSLLAAGLYFAVVILSLFPFPRLGMKEEVVRPLMKDAGEGHWVDKPHCAIGAATLYFFLLGALDLFVLSWVDTRGLW